MNETTQKTAPAWSARCDCYNYHPSASGRCTCRSDSGGGRGVTDPTRPAGQVAICEHCRTHCPAGAGPRKG